MKIAVTSTGKDLQATLDERFGRAAFFIVVDPDTLEYRIVENTQNLSLPQGAGIQAARTIIENGAEALITGFCGPKAFRVLDAAGVRIFTGASGPVDKVIEAFKEGRLSEARGANADAHWA
jgi:predicted Fe-Mo cluster-binding NifX family protein